MEFDTNISKKSLDNIIIGTYRWENFDIIVEREDRTETYRMYISSSAGKIDISIEYGACPHYEFYVGVYSGSNTDEFYDFLIKLISDNIDNIVAEVESVPGDVEQLLTSVNIKVVFRNLTTNCNVTTDNGSLIVSSTLQEFASRFKKFKFKSNNPTKDLVKYLIKNDMSEVCNITKILQCVRVKLGNQVYLVGKLNGLAHNVYSAEGNPVDLYSDTFNRILAKLSLLS